MSPAATENGKRSDCEANEEEEENEEFHEEKPLIHGRVDGGLASLQEQFGLKLLVMLFASQHLMKGFAAALCGPSVSYLFRAYSVAGPQMQVFGGITQLPWAMKPVIGLISDAQPVRGYHKAPYMLLACSAGVVACIVVGSVPQEHLSVTSLVACLFMIQMQFSVCDLLTEAKYAEKMRERPAYGPALMSYVWFGLNAGGLLATLAVGSLIAYSVRAPFLVAIIPMSFILFPLSANYLEEVPRSAARTAADRARLFAQKEACFLCGLMFAGTLALTFVGIHYQSVRMNAAVALVVALVMLAAFSIVLKPIIAKVNAFFLLQTSAMFSIGGGSFYFYTDGPDEFPAGPHFSQEFFTSVLGIVSSLCALAGIYTYQRYGSDWSYRGLLFWTNIVLSVLSLTDVAFFLHLNRKVGIPDHAFVLGGSVFTGVIGQWMWMPGVVILSQLCPEGMEATMYALLAGCHNLGNTIASNCGALVLEWLKCEPDGSKNESKQFENLWLASVLSTVLPMFTLLLLPWLIPDARQTDKLLAEHERDATEGSLWRRWQASRSRPVVFENEN